jgi:hypothetical protein
VFAETVASEDEGEKTKNTFFCLAAVFLCGRERKLKEKKKGSYRCRLFFSPLYFFGLESKLTRQSYPFSLFAWKGSFFPHRTFHPRSNLLLKFVLYFSL